MIKNIAVSLFGTIVEDNIDMFDSLKDKLKQSRMHYNVIEYVSLLFFISLLTFIIVITTGSFFITLITALAAYAYTFSIIIAVFISAFIFFIGYYIPFLKASNMENRIRKQLPFIVVYMASIASSNIAPRYIFKMASFKGGIIGDECKRIYRDVELLGMDIKTAISKAANRTPSARFAELLWGMLSVITRGGNLAEYLDEKAKEFMSSYRRSLSDYSKQISFYTEIYITLIIVGTLFFIVLSSIMGPLIGTDILFLQTLLVFLFIPFISAGFIVVLRGLSPIE